jgi:methylation protein EvaC
VVRAATERGLQSLCAFFERETATQILDQHGQADAIVAANCMCHIPYMDSVLGGVKALLRPDGLFVFEDPYLPAILEGGAFDQFYNEHVFYFSVTSVANMMAAHGLELVGARPQPVHGGSMRYYVAHEGARPPDSSVADAMLREREQGLTRPEAFADLRRRAEHVRTELPRMLRELAGTRKKVVGYAATAKSATVLNYAGISSELLPWICDTTPGKHGRYTPGTHIPVLPYEEFASNHPDYALLFAWNHAPEILEKERQFQARGGRFIVYVPELRVLEPKAA